MNPRRGSSRIAFITTSFPRHAGDPGGHFVHTEARELAAEGHEVFVFCPGAPSASMAQDGLAVLRCGGADAFGWPGALTKIRQRPRLVASAARFVAQAMWEVRRRGPFDRIVAHFIVPSAAIAAAAPDAELEVVGHGSDLRLLARLPGRHLFLRRLLRRGATFRFASERGRDELTASLRPSVRSALHGRSRVEAPALHLPLPSPAAIAQRRRELATDERPLVALCGRLVRAKGFDRALDVVAEAGCHAIVIGDGPERLALERRVSAKGATFIGLVPRDDALLAIAASDALLHASHAEGAPTVVREARAMGIPVVCTQMGDIAQWADKDPGISMTSAFRLKEVLRNITARAEDSPFR